MVFLNMRRSKAGRTSRPLMANTGLRQGLRPAAGAGAGGPLNGRHARLKTQDLRKTGKGMCLFGSDWRAGIIAGKMREAFVVGKNPMMHLMLVADSRDGLAGLTCGL